jgi:anti-sigma-K factor RskA
VNDEHEAIRSLLGAYALDAVDPDERDVVETHLRTCGVCRAEVTDHREVAAALASGSAAAPADLWDRIAGAIDDPPPPEVIDLGRVRTVRRGAPRRLGAVVAAAAAVAVLALVAGGTIARQDQQIDDLAARVDEAEAGPSMRVAELSSADGAISVSAVVAGSRGYLLAADLPPLDANHTYQLWGITDGQARSLGLLGNDPSLETFEVRDGVTTLAVTEEQTPGVDQSSVDPTVAGDLI